MAVQRWGQDNSQERMKWMSGRTMVEVSFIPLTLFRGDESCSASVRGLGRGKRRSAFHGRIGQMRRVGNINQVNRLHYAFRLCVLQASPPRHSREHTLSSTSSEQSDWSRSDFWFMRTHICVCVCVCVVVTILLQPKA